MPDAPPRLSIVVPLFNEEENLPALDGEIRAALEPLGLAYEVLYVDDGSTDGGLEVLREMAARDGRIRILRHRMVAQHLE